MVAQVFTIANQKGGVGKTTTSINLGAALAEKDIPTLIIDIDPQGNATSGLGQEKTAGKSLYGPLSGEGNASDLIIGTGIQNLYLIPSEVDIAALEIEISQRDDYLMQLRRCIAPLKDSSRFKSIIIDCPPALGLLSMNGLAAANYLLITLQCEYLAMEGLGQILQVVERLKTANINANLEVGGIIMTMYDVRTNLSKQVVIEVSSHFEKEVFNTVIPRSVRLSEAPSFGQSILHYDPHCTGSLAYRNLAKEVIQRFNLS